MKKIISLADLGFKPCYKWNTFNTLSLQRLGFNMIKSFKPCYKWNTFNTIVLVDYDNTEFYGFKPCYKWNTFNTMTELSREKLKDIFLNLVIS